MPATLGPATFFMNRDITQESGCKQQYNLKRGGVGQSTESWLEYGSPEPPQLQQHLITAVTQLVVSYLTKSRERGTVGQWDSQCQTGHQDSVLGLMIDYSDSIHVRSLAMLSDDS
jgi:hypothetical protein